MDIEKKSHPTLGRWSLLKTLGTGYNSKVKLGVDPVTNQYGAVKTINLKHPSLNLKNLMGEVKTMKALSHPNIVNLIEFHENIDYVKRDGRKIAVVAIVMELAQGGELFEYVASSGRFSEATARFYFKQMIETLSYCHNQGITHRDMKPENLLFDESFNLKLADFGFATAVAGRDGSNQLHTVLGTESYMAPEIHARKAYSGASVDIFASAIILFIMISGTPPFAKADPKDPHYRILTLGRFDVFWNAHEKNKPKKPFYSESFKDLIQRMLALDPKDRLSADDVLAHPWLSGPTNELSGIREEFFKRKNLVDQSLKAQKEQREKEKQMQKMKQAQVAGGAFTGFRPYRDGEIEKDLEGQLKDLKVPFDSDLMRELAKYEGVTLNPATEVMTVLEPLTLLKQVAVLANSVFTDYTISENAYKIKGKINSDKGALEMAINITKVDDETNCVEFTKKKGDAMDFYSTIEEKFIKPIQELTASN